MLPRRAGLLVIFGDARRCCFWPAEFHYPAPHSTPHSPPENPDSLIRTYEQLHSGQEKGAYNVAIVLVVQRDQEDPYGARPLTFH